MEELLQSPQRRQTSAEDSASLPTPEMQPEHPDAYARLGALMRRLHVHGMTTVLQRRSLIVINRQGTGEGAAAQPSDTVTCGPREDDGGRLWFFDAWGKPLAEADDIVGAAVMLAGKLRA